MLSLKPRYIILTLVAATVLSLAGFSIAKSLGENKDTERNDALLKSIDINVEKLVSKIQTESTISKALQVREALLHRDYETAQKISEAVLKESSLEDWRFYPFTDFISVAVKSDRPDFADRLDEWVATDKSGFIAKLHRAQYEVDTAWEKRGGGFISEIDKSSLALFSEYMQKGLSDIDEVIALDNAVPYSHYLKLKILQGIGAHEKLESAFETARKQYPSYYPIYDIVLRTLHPKWGGSIDAMYAFTALVAGDSEPDSPLRILYLRLYASLADYASMACFSYKGDADKLANCVVMMMEKFIRPGLEDSIKQALSLYDTKDHYQFGLVVSAILSDFRQTSGADSYSALLLQWSANAMHSDTRLKETEEGHNNYIIDLAVAESWRMKKFPQNAFSKLNEAIKDLDNTKFPSEEERDQALAKIYTAMVRVHASADDYPQTATYEEAAIKLGGSNGAEEYGCYAYFQLKLLRRAVDFCTGGIFLNPYNMNAVYWRGESYKDLGRRDEALADLTKVADSHGSFRLSAVISMSMIYFGQNDNKAALDLLNKYEHLYAGPGASRSNIAVAYNNRCYAYMELGELQKALDDCTNSMRYGSIPDAYRKHDELLKRLSQAQTP